MIDNTALDQIKAFMQSIETQFDSGHGLWHATRVLDNALVISEGMDCDRTVVQVAALVHDIYDYKFVTNATSIKEALQGILLEIGLTEFQIEKVNCVIDEISFDGPLASKRMNSVESEIVSDADRLEAIGAIGIARVFTYSGYKGRPIIDDVQPIMHDSRDSYRSGTSSAIRHFYEKLLFISDGMYTETGREMAKVRHNFMLIFLEEFYREAGLQLPMWHQKY